MTSTKSSKLVYLEAKISPVFGSMNLDDTFNLKITAATVLRRPRAIPSWHRVRLLDLLATNIFSEYFSIDVCTVVKNPYKNITENR